MYKLKLVKIIPDENVEIERKAVRGSISESEIKEWLEKILKWENGI